MINNEVRVLDKLERARDEAGPPHSRKRVKLQHVDAIAKARDHVRRCARIVSDDPLKNCIEIILRPFADDDLHRP